MKEVAERKEGQSSVAQRVMRTGARSLIVMVLLPSAADARQRGFSTTQQAAAKLERTIHSNRAVPFNAAKTIYWLRGENLFKTSTPIETEVGKRGILRYFRAVQTGDSRGDVVVKPLPSDAVQLPSRYHDSRFDGGEPSSRGLVRIDPNTGEPSVFARFPKGDIIGAELPLGKTTRYGNDDIIPASTLPDNDQIHFSYQLNPQPSPGTLPHTE